MELGETPEDCARREVYEETSVELNSLKLIGAWHIEKLFHSKYNGRYLIGHISCFFWLT